jgi:hypothetical protein
MFRYILKAMYLKKVKTSSNLEGGSKFFLDEVSNNNVVSGVFFLHILHHWSRSLRKEPQIIDPLPCTRNGSGSSFVYPKELNAPEIY